MLQERLREDLKRSLRRREEVRCSVMRLALAALHNAEIAAGKPLDDAGVLAVLAKEARQRRESIAAYQQAHRADLVAREEAELAILQEYLPQPLSFAEIAAAAQAVIAEVGATGPKDLGKVMPRLMAQLRGRAEGAEVNRVVSELLGRL